MKKIILASCLSLFSLLLSSCVSALTYKQHLYGSEDVSSIIQTTDGPVQGTKISNGTVRFLGIPFAKPPVGQLRFKAPQPNEKWNSVLHADTMPSFPYQEDALKKPEDYSEDCLYLNIFLPEQSPVNAPVIIFIYGGSYDSGCVNYHFEDLAKSTGAIIAEFNYRVNALGFLNFADLSENFDNNLGLKDQMAAVKWIHDNAENFGGDSGNITLWGQSAGAGSVSVLMQNRQTAQLFNKAILMSDCFEFVYTQEEEKEFRNMFLEQLGIEQNDVDQLLEMESSKLIEAAKALKDAGKPEYFTTTFRPVCDGEIFDTPMLQADLSQIGKPLLMGNTKDEGNLFFVFRKKSEIKNNFSVKQILKNVSMEEQYRLFSTYKGYPEKKADQEIISDVMFRVPAIRYADRYSSSAPVYMYRFDDYPSGLGVIGLNAFHIIDLLMVAGTSKPSKASDYLTAGIGNFARTGNPNIEGTDTWQPYTASDRNIMVIGKKQHLEKNLYDQAVKKFEGMEYMLVKNKSMN